MSSAQTSSERKASSFANPARQAKVTKRIKPLNREFFTQLIKLEADFQNKNYTVITLDELIQFYARAVEYYDSIKDEISAYFIFKIQDILATKKSLKMLLDQNAKGGVKRGAQGEPIEEGDRARPHKSSNKQVTFGDAGAQQEDILEEVSSEDDEDDEEKHLTEFEKKRKTKRMQRNIDRMSISRMKKQKQIFVNFFYKMEAQKVSEKQNMGVVMNGFGTMSDKNDGFVKKDIDFQRDRLRKRLDKKKGDSYMHSFQFGNSTDDNQDRKDDIIFENFLEGLGEQQKDASRDDQGKEESDHTDSGSLSDHPMFSENNPLRANVAPRSLNEEIGYDKSGLTKKEVGSNQTTSFGTLQSSNTTTDGVYRSNDGESCAFSLKG